jgi:uncharacterized protein (DUF2249 family)
VFSRKQTLKFGDGRLYYRIDVFVIAPEEVMSRIDLVTYHLEDAWPPHLRNRVIEDRESRFTLREVANGTSIIRADVKLKGQDELLSLNRFIDLRADGAQL